MPRTAHKDVTPEQRAQWNAEREERVNGLLAQVQEGVAAVATSDRWRAMLQSTARFHSYSFRNRLLIFMQMPTATRVAGYRTWQSMGRQVRKGEHSIAVLAPVSAWVDKEGNRVAGGKTRITAAEAAARGWKRRIVGWTTERVFDISQTDGEPLPGLGAPVLPEGEAPEGAMERLTAFFASNGFSVRYDELDGGAYAHIVYEAREIVIRPDLPPAFQLTSAIHEAAHLLLHQPSDPDRPEDRRIRETEAESAAFITARVLGVPDGDQFSFDYLAGWTDGQPDLILAVADRIVRASRALLDVLAPAEDAAPGTEAPAAAAAATAAA